MFGFSKADCNDMDLFGYLFQSCGGVHNTLAIDKNFTYELNSYDDFERYQKQLIGLVHHMLGQKRKKLTKDQEQLIILAANIVAKHLYDHNEIPNNKIKPCVLRFAEIMCNGSVGFTLQESSINIFRDELERLGCVFKF